MKKILLHACCAPCASYPIQKLKLEGFDLTVFFYNPNIFPYREYLIRRNELKNYCEKQNIKYIEQEYEIKKYYEAIKGFENEKEKGKRCEKCFYLRLNKTAHKALELEIPYFTTTLSISPHKNSNQIFESAKEVLKDIKQKYKKEINLEFLEYNFKKQDGFKISRSIAKENNMYAQTYCGCEFSRRISL